MHGPTPFRSGPRSSRSRRSPGRRNAAAGAHGTSGAAGDAIRPAPRIPLTAEQRLRRAHRHRLRALREWGLEAPTAILERHPQDLAWRVSVLDRWIARHLDLAGGRRLPPWTDAVDAGGSEDVAEGGERAPRAPEEGA